MTLTKTDLGSAVNNFKQENEKLNRRQKLYAGQLSHLYQLVVDDINDTGATISWIKNSWESSAGFISWDGVWGNNVRFAVLVNNVSSKESADYTGVTIDKSVDDSWIVFPFESWWNQ